MKLSEIKGEAAMEALVNIIEPVSELAEDKEFLKLVRNKAPYVAWAKHALKHHQRSCIQVMAALDGKSVDEYEFTLLSLPAKLVSVFREITSDPELAVLFQSQGQNTEEASSGSASESTGA